MGIIIGGATAIDMVRTRCLLSIKNIDVHSWLSQKFWDNSGEFVGLELNYRCCSNTRHKNSKKTLLCERCQRFANLPIKNRVLYYRAKVKGTKLHGVADTCRCEAEASPSWHAENQETW